MKNSIKILMMIVAIAAVVVSCKKVDNPKPSTKVFLTAHTWYVTSISGSSMNPDDCSDNLAFQFSTAQTFYVIQNCSSPGNDGTWSLDGDNTTINFSEGIFKIVSIDATSLTMTYNGDTYVCTAR